MIDKVSFIVSGVDKVTERLNNLLDKNRLRASANASAVRLKKVFTNLTPVSNDPNDPQRGNLKKSWKSEVLVQDRSGMLLLQLKNTDPRARLVWPLLMRGSKPHLIRAKRKLALSFMLKTGKQFVGKQVNHPGFPPKVDKMQVHQAVNDEIGRLKKAIEDTLKKPHA